MIETTQVYIAHSTEPCRNLAVEEYLLSAVKPGECILYLWQNEKTVVIGRNQNAYKECNTEKLLRNGGQLVRRLSGGGCVYHDLGNLNFTFLMREEDYDVPRQLSVIARALKDFGLEAQPTGRNDICIDGRKFSGNAFYRHKGRCYHHGTILIDADMGKMSEYLNVSAEKLRANSVASVKSRVVNLRELNPGIGLQAMQRALCRAFGEVYSAKPHEIPTGEIDENEIAKLREKYACEEWIYGTHMRADCSFEEKFPWGAIECRLRIKANRIDGAQIFSDCMDAGLAEALARRLEGVVFRKEAVLAVLNEKGIYEDIYALFEKQKFWQEC